jgi:hypothetical protein
MVTLPKIHGQILQQEEEEEGETALVGDKVALEGRLAGVVV